MIAVAAGLSTMGWFRSRPRLRCSRRGARLSRCAQFRGLSASEREDRRGGGISVGEDGASTSAARVSR